MISLDSSPTLSFTSSGASTSHVPAYFSPTSACAESAPNINEQQSESAESSTNRPVREWPVDSSCRGAVARTHPVQQATEHTRAVRHALILPLLPVVPQCGPGHRLRAVTFVHNDLAFLIQSLDIREVDPACRPRTVSGKRSDDTKKKTEATMGVAKKKNAGSEDAPEQRHAAGRLLLPRPHAKRQVELFPNLPEAGSDIVGEVMPGRRGDLVVVRELLA